MDKVDKILNYFTTTNTDITKISEQLGALENSLSKINELIDNTIEDAVNEKINLATNKVKAKIVLQYIYR